MSSLEKYSLRGLHSPQPPAPEPAYTCIQVETGFRHAEEQEGSPVHAEYWSESHIAGVSNYPQSHSPSIYSLSLWFNLFTNTASCAWAQPHWNRCSALAGCWSVTVQSKVHRNQHTNSHGLAGALQWLLNIWLTFPSAASSCSKAAQRSWFGNCS